MRPPSFRPTMSDKEGDTLMTALCPSPSGGNEPTKSKSRKSRPIGTRRHTYLAGIRMSVVDTGSTI